VKSQTSKAVAQFRREVGHQAFPVPDALEPEPLESSRWRRGNRAG
jgi:hypothetical protein